MIKTFRYYLTEASSSKKKIEAKENKFLAEHYEIATSLEIHNRAKAATKKEGLKFDDSSDHIQKLRARAKELEKIIGPDYVEENSQKAKDSAESYLESIERNHGIKASDIESVLHTGTTGISKLIGQELSPEELKENPHDVLIKTRKPYTLYKGLDDEGNALPKENLEKYSFHGASLKRGAATESNMGVGRLSKVHSGEEKENNRIGAEISDIWTKGKKKIAAATGLEDLLRKAKTEEQRKKIFKAWQQRPDVLKAYYETRKKSVEHHNSSFNGAESGTQKDHLEHLLKGKAIIPYDRVSAVTKVSEPYDKSPARSFIRKCKSFRAEKSGDSLVNFYGIDGDGTEQKICTSEHRATHRAFKSLQVNTKMKESKAKSKEQQTSKPAPAPAVSIQKPIRPVSQPVPQKTPVAKPISQSRSIQTAPQQKSQKPNVPVPQTETDYTNASNISLGLLARRNDIVGQRASRELERRHQQQQMGQQKPQVQKKMVPIINMSRKK